MTRIPKKTKPPVASETKRRRWIIIWSVIGVLVIFRLLLPTIVLKYVNKTLEEMEEYTGHVEDIDIALLRGAYVINDIKLVKIENKYAKNDTLPFFSCREIDLSVEWGALFKGALVAEVVLDEPRLNFVKEPPKATDKNLKGDTADFRQLVDDLLPLSINRFEIKNAQIHYVDPASDPKVDLALTEFNVLAKNLTNVRDTSLLPSSVKADGNIYGGEFNLEVKLDALNKQPTFDMNMEVKQLDMVALNDFLRAYGNFDVKKGEFNVYGEFAAKEGSFGGYVKPMIKDLDIVQWKKEEGNAGQILWETIVGSVAEIFQNQTKEQLATKVPIEGKFEADANVNIWQTMVYVLRNAFVAALRPSIDQTININKIEDDGKVKLFEKVSGEKEDTKSKKELRKEKKEERKKAKEGKLADERK